LNKNDSYYDASERKISRDSKAFVYRPLLKPLRKRFSFDELHYQILGDHSWCRDRVVCRCARRQGGNGARLGFKSSAELNPHDPNCYGAIQPRVARFINRTRHRVWRRRPGQWGLGHCSACTRASRRILRDAERCLLKTGTWISRSGERCALLAGLAGCSNPASATTGYRSSSRILA
jgi:hypothetical protein